MDNIEIIATLTTQLPEEFILQNNEIALQGAFTQSDLSNLVQQLLQAENSREYQEAFDFIIGGYILKTSLGEHVDTYSIRTEKSIAVEYIFAQREPQLKNSTQMNDWIIKVMEMQNQIILGLSNGQIVLCNKNGKKLKTYATRAAKAFACYGDLIISTHWDSQVLVHQLVDQELSLISSVKLSHYGECIAVNPFNGRIFSIGCSDGTLMIFNLDKLDDQSELIAVASYKIHQYQVTCCQWMSAQVTITGSLDHSIAFFNAKKGELIKQYFAKDSVITDLHYFANDKTIITSHEDGYLKLWDTEKSTGMPHKIYKSSFSTVTSIAANDEHTVLAASMDGKVNLWDLRAEAPQFNIGVEGKVLSVAWIGGKIVFGGSSNKLYIYQQ